MQPDLIDRIYEASVVPDLWPAVLDDVAALSDARGGLLFSARRTLHWTASDTVRHVFAEYVSDGWFTSCARRVCMMGQDSPAFFTELDFWTEETLREEPIYRDFFVPHGLGWSAGTALKIPTGDNIVFSIERQQERGPIEREYIERLNVLRPHLARSAFVAARLQLQRAQGAAEALDALRLPAMLIAENGTLVQASPLLETLGALVQTGAHDKVWLADKRAQEMLDEAVAAIKARAELPARSFPLRDAAGQSAAVVHVLPVTRSAHDIFGESYALVLLTPIASERMPSSGLMRSLFDLTASEARVAGGLATGKTLEEIAAEGEVAMTTVRSQLRRVLEKTGCTRQAEVAALLASISLGEAGEG